MNDILHLVTVYEVLIYCQTIQGVGGYWKEESDNVEYGLNSPDGFIIDVSWLVYNKNVGESGHSISSYSDSSRYSTEMLTEGAQVDSSSTRQL